MSKFTTFKTTFRKFELKIQKQFEKQPGCVNKLTLYECFQATKAVIHREAPGLAIQMISKSLEVTSMAMLSRLENKCVCLFHNLHFRLCKVLIVVRLTVHHTYLSYPQASLWYQR